MSVVVLIPCGGDDPHRAHALGIVFAYYRDFFDFDVMAVPDANVDKGSALNMAVRELGPEHDLLVLNDGDSLVPPHQLAQAVRLAALEPGLVFAYTRYRRVNQETSQRVSAAVELFGLGDESIEWEKLESGSHGCVAIRRACWDTVGGLDPAFGMAGYEDLAFNTVCEAHWPSRRVAGDLYHLWHPRGWDADPEREAANLRRYREQYLAHWGDKQKLLEVRNG